MADRSPPPLTGAQRRIRHSWVARIARKLGFVGAVEYRHVHCKSGGAQYGQGETAADDLLIVYAEAFDRDANPDDFSLTAILAHECGHQILARHQRIARQVKGKLSDASEEILAAVLGSLLCEEVVDQDNLTLQAAAILADHGQSAAVAIQRIQGLRTLFEELL